MPEGVKDAAIDMASHSVGLPPVRTMQRLAEMIAPEASHAPTAAAAKAPLKAAAGSTGWLDAAPGDYEAAVSGPPSTRIPPPTRPGKYASPAPVAPEPSHGGPIRGVGGGGLSPEEQAAERAWKRSLVDQHGGRVYGEPPPDATFKPERPDTSIGPRNYFLKKPDSEPSFMGYGNPPDVPSGAGGGDVEALAQELAAKLGMTADDALALIEQQPEMKSVTKDAMRRAVSGKVRRR